MRINRVETNKLAFKSLRTDRNRVEQLKTGEKPLIENNKINIFTALNSLKTQPDRANIEFLLDVADNLTYGQGGEDSEFKTALDEDGFSSSERENTDWSKALKETISYALATSNDDVEDLHVEFERVFSQRKELTEEQKRILDLRKSLTQAIIGEDTIEDPEKLSQTTNILKNIDYFVASSEIPAVQKENVLRQLVYFMSDDYEIDPQLSDKKAQVVDEMLEDMIIKTPENDVLTTKGLDQRQSGICAAISVSRKQMAYEDKEKFVSMIMDELSSSQKMKVYDITELGTGKQIEIVKPEIEYTTALKNGYRIIDTAAHIWMHNAHSSGDGTIQTEYYVAFDDENYGIFNDSSWYLGIGEKALPEKLFLTALIKENEYLKSFQKTKKEFVEAQKNLSSIKKEVFETQSAARGSAIKSLSDVFPEKGNKDISKLFASLVKFYTGKKKTNEVNVAQQLPKEVQLQLVTDFIRAEFTDITPEQSEKLDKVSPNIVGMLDEYSSAEEKLEKIQSFNSQKGKYIYNKKLFNVAAAHRVAMESDINIPNSVIRWETSVELPPRDIQISEYLSKIQVKDENQRKELMSDVMFLDSVLPKEIDEVTEVILGHNIKELTSLMFANMQNQVENGDEAVIDHAKALLGINEKGKSKVIRKLQQWIDKLENEPSEKTISEAIRVLGYEDRVQYANIFLAEYFNSLRNGISEDEAEALAEKFGGMDKISNGLEAQRLKFESAKQKYALILDKWEVPTARQLILERLENKYKLISREKLNKLKHRFDTIQAGMIENEKIENTKERARANSKLYTFTTEEQEILNQIEKQIYSMKKYQKINYLSVNKALFKELEEQYANIGMLNGQFWVREEGSSGLASTEQIRIVEQMTGKPHHLERNIKKAAEHIKEGNGSGVLSMSVLDDDYGFHAQYIPSVTSEKVQDPKTGRRLVKDIVWTDNSWGNAEKNAFWDAKDGFLHTDYGNGYGWQNGFYLAPDQRIGLTTDEMFGAVGIAKKDDNEKFGLLTGVILEGTPTETYQKLFKVFNYILNMDDVYNVLDGLETALTSGYKFSVKELEGLDELAEIKLERLRKRAEKEINSKEEYDKLPEDDELKLTFEKIAVHMATDNPTLQDGLLTIDNPKDLENAAQEIFQETAEEMGALMCKSDNIIDTLYVVSASELEGIFAELESKFGVSLSVEVQGDIINEILNNEEELKKSNGSLSGLQKIIVEGTERAAEKYIQNEDARYFFTINVQKLFLDNIEQHVRIKSLDDPILSNSPLGKHYIAAIDKYLNPASDKELLDFIQGMQHADFDVADKFFDALKPEDVGLDFRSGYEYLQLFKADNSAVAKIFSDVVTTQEIYKNLRTTDGPNQTTPEECFRDLYVKLADMDVQKYIKAFKAEAFQKYQVRQAFPEPKVLKDEHITEYLAKNIVAIQQGVSLISGQQLGIDILTTYNKLLDEYSDSKTFKSLMNKESFVITEENKEEVAGIVNKLTALSTLTAMDSTIRQLNLKLNSLVEELMPENDEINGRKAGKLLKDVLSEFEGIESSGNTLSNYIQNKKEAIDALKNQIEFLVVGNVDPKYRNEARNKFNKLITAYKNCLPAEETDILEQEIDDLFVEKHIVKNPKVLLKELTQMLLDGKQNTQAYIALKAYLQSALQVAQQTKIQYKLVQNQHEAISSKTKSMLGLFSVYDAAGKKYSMDSDMGMVYFVEKLRNESDNHVTLNLFLEQSGLTTRALNALLTTINLNEAKADLEGRINKIKTNISILDKFAAITEGYFERRHIPRKNWEETVQQFMSFTERQLKEYKDTELYKYYMECLEAARKMDNFDSTPKELFNDILKDGNREALYQTAQNINAEITQLDTVSTQLEDRAELICSIRVPQQSQASKKRSTFINEYSKIGEYLETQKNVLATLVGNSQALATMQY